jgi:hypothetical protein
MEGKRRGKTEEKPKGTKDLQWLDILWPGRGFDGGKTNTVVDTT